MQACELEWFEIISEWVDGETPASDRARVERHLARCARCAELADGLRRLGASLAAREPDLSRRALEVAHGRATALRARRTWRRSPLLMSSVAVVVAAASFLVFVRDARPALDAALADDLVGHHLRGFAREHPCDFASDAPAAVRAWIHHELAYDVDVPALPGAVLLGARACRLRGVRTAAVLYRKDGVPLTVFLPPEGSDPARRVRAYAPEVLRCGDGPLAERICAIPRRAGAPMVAVGSPAERSATDLARAR